MKVLEYMEMSVDTWRRWKWKCL